MIVVEVCVGLFVILLSIILLFILKRVDADETGITNGLFFSFIFLWFLYLFVYLPSNQTLLQYL